jgi:hypothetical protein
LYSQGIQISLKERQTAMKRETVKSQIHYLTDLGTVAIYAVELEGRPVMRLTADLWDPNRRQVDDRQGLIGTGVRRPRGRSCSRRGACDWSRTRTALRRGRMFVPRHDAGQRDQRLCVRASAPAVPAGPA